MPVTYSYTHEYEEKFDSIPPPASREKQTTKPPRASQTITPVPSFHRIHKIIAHHQHSTTNKIFDLHRSVPSNSLPSNDSQQTTLLDELNMLTYWTMAIIDHSILQDDDSTYQHANILDNDYNRPLHTPG
uniref:Uncharacterized protein n=1 Tax=Cacopsylla melanoneura TaxID=428564 RepID=A0A8D8ZM88_9HEMI